MIIFHDFACARCYNNPASKLSLMAYVQGPEKNGTVVQKQYFSILIYAMYSKRHGTSNVKTGPTTRITSPKYFKTVI